MTTLLYSGNLGIGQDLGTVLRAAACLNGDVDLHILIVGNGKGLAETRRLVEQLALQNIEFREPVPLYRLSDLLAGGDIHVICQKAGTEGLLVPSKIYGTLAVGRPTIFIGPEHCEVAQIVRDSRCGFIVEPGDVQGTVNALALLVRSTAMRQEMGENAKEYYEHYFGRKRSVARIIDVLEQVAGSRQ
jgi:glycosyltransferase involved in cell wall biosynthesis